MRLSIFPVGLHRTHVFVESHIGSDSYHKCLCPFLSFGYNSPSN